MKSKHEDEKRPVGAPVTVDGRRVSVYLDEASIQMAAELGGGNISEGIRRALKQAGGVRELSTVG